jgi:U32 family peptidase
VLSPEWREKYTNIASSNRREWKTANLTGFDDLRKTVEAAHKYNVPVYLALNAFYSGEQYPLLLKQAGQAVEMGIDALIVADIGLLLTLKQEGIRIEIHMSTGGTTFNSETAKFYEELGVSRIVLPRHLMPEEMEAIVKTCPSIKFEAFILNSGCKNIDGFCTFQHGINELLYGNRWDVPKRLNFDRYLLNMIRRLPEKISRRVKGGVFGIDSACLLDYKIFCEQFPPGTGSKIRKRLIENIGANFSLLSGADPCGACRLPEFKRMGIRAVKIVGRNYSTEKKVRDVRFLKKVLSYKDIEAPDGEKFRGYVKDAFRKTYGMKCGELCYYPGGSSRIF